MKKSAAIFMLGVLVLFLASFSLAQTTDEQLTFTTYYPSPYGSYTQLQTNVLAVGSTTPMPTVNGTIDSTAVRSNFIAVGTSLFNGSPLKYCGAEDGAVAARKYVTMRPSEEMPTGVAY